MTPTPQKFVDEVEALSAILHEIYMKEAYRQQEAGIAPVRHEMEYSKLKESTKEYDRVLARYILQREAQAEARGRLAGLEEGIKAVEEADPLEAPSHAWEDGPDDLLAEDVQKYLVKIARSRQRSSK